MRYKNALQKTSEQLQSNNFISFHAHCTQPIGTRLLQWDKPVNSNFWLYM